MPKDIYHYHAKKKKDWRGATLQYKICEENSIQFNTRGTAHPSFGMTKIF